MKKPRSHVKVWKRILYVSVVLSLAFLIGFILLKRYMASADRGNAAMIIRNAQQGMNGQCGINGIDRANVAKSYREHYELHTGTEAPFDLHEQIFGPEGMVITPERGQLPEHPVEEARFDFTLGDPDLLPPLGTMYITTKGVKDPEFYRPQNIEQRKNLNGGGQISACFSGDFSW